MGQEFGKGLAQMAWLCSAIWGHIDSGSALGDSNNYGLELFKGFFIHPSGIWVVMTPRLNLVETVNWNTYTRPLCAAWASSEPTQACLDSKRQCLQEWHMENKYFNRTRQKLYGLLQHHSDILHNYFHCIPLVTSKSQRQAQIQDEELLRVTGKFSLQKSM